MGFEDRLLAASFRGISFSVESHAANGGRTIVKHEIPYRDTPFVEDLGRAARTHSIEAFLVGDDYMERRDRLLRALENQDTPGLLIHPYLGALTVAVGAYRLQESSRDRLICKLSIEFVEVGPRSPVTTTASPKNAVDEKAGLLQDEASAKLEDELVTKGVPAPQLAAAQGEVSKVGQALAALGSLGSLADDGAELARKAADLIGKAQALALAPIDLAVALREAIDSVQDAAENAIDALSAYEQLELLVPEILAGDQEQKNATLVTDAARRSALAGWSRSLVRVDWESYEDALAARASFEERLDAQADLVSGSEYHALRALRAAVAAGVPPPDRDLPRVTTLALKSAQPAAVLAYRLYDDADRGDEIASRNRARNPLVLPGGATLEVLTL